MGRTSIFSKRWRYVWTYHPILEFNHKFRSQWYTYHEQACYKDSVDHAIFCHGGSTIEKCSFHCDAKLVSRYLFGWVSAVLTCNVKELSIESFSKVQELPPSLFTCKTLVVLKISGSFLLNLPFHVCFPSLKTLSLEFVIYGDDLSMQRLFSSCPVLEDLKINRGRWDGVLITFIFVPSLKRLSILQSYMDIKGHECKTVIDAPKLEYLELDVVQTKVYTNLSDSLVEVYICSGCALALGILEEISHVRQLAISGNAF